MTKIRQALACAIALLCLGFGFATLVAVVVFLDGKASIIYPAIFALISVALMAVLPLIDGGGE